MDDEQDLAADFMRSLHTDQQGEATLSVEKSRGENQAEMMRDNAVVPYEGLPARA